ncbi:hypothetical protein [Gemella sp. zg-570]|nr:hypothetical protein [Gemella sp. zg-570]
MLHIEEARGEFLGASRAECEKILSYIAGFSFTLISYNEAKV